MWLACCCRSSSASSASLYAAPEALRPPTVPRSSSTRFACCASREAGQPICCSCVERPSSLPMAGMRPTSSFTKAEYMLMRACTAETESTLLVPMLVPMDTGEVIEGRAAGSGEEEGGEGGGDKKSGRHKKSGEGARRGERGGEAGGEEPREPAKGAACYGEEGCEWRGARGMGGVARRGAGGAAPWSLASLSWTRQASSPSYQRRKRSAARRPSWRRATSSARGASRLEG